MNKTIIMAADDILKTFQPKPLPAVIILNGEPGVGKLTVAQKLKDFLTSFGIKVTFVDNHLLIDPTTAIAGEDRSDPFHWETRTLFRKTAFKCMQKDPDSNTAFLFTSCLSTEKTGTDQFLEFFELATNRNLPLIFVQFRCNLDTLVRRATSEERRKSNKGKLTDADVVRKLREMYTLLDPSKNTAQLINISNNVLMSTLRFSELDVSEFTVEETASAVLNIILQGIYS
mmetsp:Transcript_5003/g.5723  ORF Transcript_5003/g.5723 Transcript_5003/m.5723 type:complete len:229 (-) Transcript_5003:103-789(-)